MGLFRRRGRRYNRLTEGALSAERTPRNPPTPTKLVPLDKTVAPIDYEGKDHPDDCRCEACASRRKAGFRA